MNRTWTVAVVLVWAMTACGGSSDGPRPTGPDSTSGATTTDVGGDVSARTTDVQPDVTSSETPSAAEQLADMDGLATIAVATPTSGNGEFPLLAWTPVDGVDLYALTLTTSGGQSYWAWSGHETEIYLGGLNEPPPPDSGGPYLFEPMELLVVGLDDVGNVVAASAPTTIAP